MWLDEVKPPSLVHSPKVISLKQTNFSFHDFNKFISCLLKQNIRYSPVPGFDEVPNQLSWTQTLYLSPTVLTLCSFKVISQLEAGLYTDMFAPGSAEGISSHSPLYIFNNMELFVFSISHFKNFVCGAP